MSDIQVFVDVDVTINSNTVRATKVTVDAGLKEIPSTRMGDTAPNSIAGMQKPSITCVFLQGYAGVSSGDMSIHEVLQDALDNTEDGTGNTVTVKPSADSSLSWTLSNAKLFDYKPIDAGVDDKQDVTVVFKSGGSRLSLNTSSS